MRCFKRLQNGWFCDTLSGPESIVVGVKKTHTGTWLRVRTNFLNFAILHCLILEGVGLHRRQAPNASFRNSFCFDISSKLPMAPTQDT